MCQKHGHDELSRENKLNERETKIAADTEGSVEWSGTDLCAELMVSLSKIF